MCVCRVLVSLWVSSLLSGIFWTMYALSYGYRTYPPNNEESSGRVLQINLQIVIVTNMVVLKNINKTIISIILYIINSQFDF